MVKASLGSLSENNIWGCVWILPPGTSGGLLPSLCLGLLICKVGLRIVPASRGPCGDRVRLTRRVLLGQCWPCLRPRWPGQGRATSGVHGPRGPLRGAEGLGPTYQPPPTQADVPSNVAEGLRSLGIAEKGWCAGGGGRTESLRSERGSATPLLRTPDGSSPS